MDPDPPRSARHRLHVGRLESATDRAAQRRRGARVGESRTAPRHPSHRSTASLLALFAALGLLLGVTGVHGVVAHRAAQRTREIGIRIAMGATPGGVVAMVVRETLLVSFAGCAAGMAGAYGLSRFLRSLLFGVAVHDAISFALFPALLLAAAALAAALPAWRASRTDPSRTLRHE